MAINRWIGQAVAAPEVAYFVPDNVLPGDRFQLSNGVQRYGFTYPPNPDETSATAESRARRVVDEIVEAATNAGVTDLGGGGETDLVFSASNYNGKPAVKVTGPSDGKPISLIATASTTANSSIKIQQMQAGSTGSDFVFTLTWVAPPTLGKWAIAASGKKPVILNYNATAAQVQSAIASFALPCASVSVTGDHTNGYSCRLVGLTAEMPNPPVLFPIVPVDGSEAILQGILYEHSSYIFGPTGSGYEEEIIEADITVAEMRAYLSDPVRMGALADAGQLGITATRITPTEGYNAGSTWTFTFYTEESYNAFVAMQKRRIIYTYYGAATVTDIGTQIQGVHSTAPGTPGDDYTKFRHKSVQQTNFGDTLNPFDRYYHTRGFKGTTANETFVINDSIPGYQDVLVKGRPINAFVGISPVAWVTQYTANFSSTSYNWTLGTLDIEMAVGINVGGATAAWSLSTIQIGSWDELGVSANSGYKIETLEQPGIINQEVLIPTLDGNSATLYQFEWEGSRSHAFNGAATMELIRDAALSLFGVKNVSAGIEKGYACRLTFVGEHSERQIVPTLYQLGDSESTGEVVVAVTAATPMVAWKLRYQFFGGICSGKWRFTDGDGTPGATWFKWVRPEEVTAEALRAAIVQLDADYEAFLEPEDIEIVTEEVGRNFILREFTINWQAQPSGASSGGATPFWVGLDVSQLKSAEPKYELVSYGEVAQPEIQLITLENKPTGGTFRLGFGVSTTAALAYDANASTIQTALSGIGVAAAVIGGSGGPWRVKWSSNGAQALITGSANLLTRSNAPTFTEAVVTSGTGPHHWNNADNWSLVRVPIATDEVVFADGSVDCLYGLSSTVNLASVDVYRSFTGRIGLPEIREDGSLETLPCWLTIDYASGTALPIRVGLGDSGEGPTTVRIEVKQRPFDLNVLYTQSGLTQKCLGIKGTASGNKLVAVNGEVALGIRPEDTALCDTVMITPGQGAGDDLKFSTSAGATVGNVVITGGVCSFGKPPSKITATGGTITVSGTGNTNEIDAAAASVRWMANGTIGKSGVPTAVLFGGALATSSASPDKVRFTSAAHGLTTGQRVYVRAYSGVQGLDGRVFTVSVVDANNFDLLGSAATGTLTGYAGAVSWAVERAAIIRAGAVLDFDSDGRARDIVAPIVLQSSGAVNDSKLSISDMRLWPEQVDAFANFGQTFELRRTAR